MTILVRVVLGLTLLFTLPAAAAVGEALDFTIHQQHISPRAMGMGGAFTAVADDIYSLFYNPAGLARTEEGNLNLGIQAMIDSGILKLQKDIEAASGGGADDTSKMVDLFEANYGKHYSSRVPTLSAMYARPRWGFAIVPVDLSLDVELHQTVGPAASVVAYQDTTFVWGYGRDLKWFKDNNKDRLSWGVALKSIYRGYFNKSVTAAELAFDQKLRRDEDAKEGLTFDADLGLLYTPSVSQKNFFRFMKYAKPTFGASVSNAVDYGFTSNLHLINKASQRPPRLERRVNLGTMLELPDLWVFKTRFAADLRDIGHHNWTWAKGTHFGFELLWKMYGWWQGAWRVGVNQGYWTFGVSGVMGIFRLDAVSYSEEVGSSDVKKENRRYMLKASLDF